VIWVEREAEYFWREDWTGFSDLPVGQSHRTSHSDVLIPNTVVVARLDRAIQYAAAYRSIAEAFGILDHPPSRVMTAHHWRRDVD
jgi:hypothetical protein